MKRPHIPYALIGATLGLIPAALLVLGDRSAGHGADTLALLALVALGVPGAAVGSVAGVVLQHGLKPVRFIAVSLGALLGGVAGLMGGLLLHESVGAAVPVREQDSACAGLFVGAVLGTLLGSLFGPPRGIAGD